MIEIPMTRAQFAEKAQQLKDEQGIEITGDSGVIEKDGYSAGYSFTGSALQVSPLNMGFVQRKIMELKIKSWLGG